jgi:hypothetical protein
MATDDLLGVLGDDLLGVLGDDLSGVLGDDLLGVLGAVRGTGRVPGPPRAFTM